jgi:hypothetical protein
MQEKERISHGNKPKRERNRKRGEKCGTRETRAIKGWKSYHFDAPESRRGDLSP